MATVLWRGGAQAIAQVSTATPANVEIGDLFSLTVNGKAVVYTAAAATVADVTAGLVAAWQASTEPEHQEVTASDAGTHVVLTAAEAGRPFTVSAAAIDGGGADTQTLTLATPTPSAGPQHWDTAANWSSGSVPANGDDVHVADAEDAIRYGLAQSAVTLASLHVAASFTGEIGLARVNEEGAAEYAEYRPRALAIGATVVEIGDGLGGGSGRVQLEGGAAASAVTVHGTGLPAEDDQPAVAWQGTHASNTLDVRAGSVGIALAGGAAATLAVLRASGGEVRAGAGLSLTNLHISGEAHVELRSSIDGLLQTGGELVLLGSGGIGSLQLDGGRVDYRSSGTVTAAALDGETALLDFSGDLRDRTVTDLTLIRGTVLDPHETVSWTGGIVPGAGVQAV